MYGNAHDSGCIIFQTRFHLFIVNSFNLRRVCLPKLHALLCRLPRANLNLGKLKICSYGILYPKNEIAWTWIILAISSQTFQRLALKCPLEKDIFVSFRHRTKWCLTFIFVYIKSAFAGKIKYRTIHGYFNYVLHFTFLILHEHDKVVNLHFKSS